MRVIVADKDPYDLDAYRSALVAPDVRVATATDGRELMRLAREQLPDIIVVASSLGSMGGFAISRDLKTLAAEGVIPDPKILVLLERGCDDWLARWSRCDRWLSKPVEPGDVGEAVRELAGPREPQTL